VRHLHAAVIAGLALLAAAPAWAQTEAIQKKLEKKLTQARQEKETRDKKDAEVALAKLLEEALKNNPDLHVAEAKVRAAEAECEQVRLKLMQEVTLAQAELQRARDAVATGQSQVQQSRTRFQAGQAPANELFTAESALQQAKANVAAAEAKLAYLVGKPAPLKASSVGWVTDLSGIDRGMAENSRRAAEKRLYYENIAQAGKLWLKQQSQALEGTMAEKLHRALDVLVTVTPGQRPLFEVLDLLRSKLKGINVNCPVPLLERQPDGQFSITEAIPLGAAVQLIEEEYRCRFVVRDYGIRIVDAEEHLPPGAVLVSDFWKQRPGSRASGGDKK
jgi:DNA repair exonuclease SbcCD ATPase subunit